MGGRLLSTAVRPYLVEEAMLLQPAGVHLSSRLPQLLAGSYGSHSPLRASRLKRRLPPWTIWKLRSRLTHPIAQP